MKSAPDDSEEEIRRQEIIRAEELSTAYLASKHPEEPIAKFFRYSHLPPELQAVSKPFSVLAVLILMTLPRNAERSSALRKLLEAKDCACRARIAE